ncbi:GH17203 [Drosophila grimshawi]|uniref:GH17203 n=2 Tax=Drosophila grimshawi TaxID=7222 RepID=B4J1V1_DROGR|nr:GH17203 [Drosophila grimshawi]
MVNVTGWYTVTISNCKELPSSSIVLALKYAILPLKVHLFDFKRSHDGSRGQFFVDNKLMANRLKRINGKV